ncbi:MAG TPA: LmeA family phospholipid-binding protein [Actinokineospora sp.]|nr:LmeA family phospholipid-binding protein [Actinokineospora sp.]
MSGPFDGWLPIRGLEAVLSAGRSLLPSVPMSPAAVVQTAVRVTAQRLRGKRVTVKSDGQDVPLTVVDLDCTGDTLRLAQGRIDAVSFEARDVAWPSLTLDRLLVTARDLRLAGPFSTAVMAESVTLAVSLSAEALRDELAKVRPDLRIRFGEALYVARDPWPGELEVVPEVDDGVARLRPTALWIAGRRLRVPARVRPFDVPLPDLPQGMRLTSVTTSADGVELRGEARHWRDRLTSTPLVELLNLLATAAQTLTIGR